MKAPAEGISGPLGPREWVIASPSERGRMATYAPPQPKAPAAALGILAVSALLAAASLAVIAALPEPRPQPPPAEGDRFGLRLAREAVRPASPSALTGDPRTTFHGPATQAGILTSRGSF